MLVEAEHLAMEEIMASVTDDGSSTQQQQQQLPVAMVCQRHLDTMLQRVSPSVKVCFGHVHYGWFQLYMFLINTSIRSPKTYFYLIAGFC